MLILKKLSDGRKEYIDKYKCLENLVKFTFLLKVMNLIGLLCLFFESDLVMNLWIFLILVLIIACIVSIAKVYKEVKEKEKSFIYFRRYLLVTNILSFIITGVIISLMIIVITCNSMCQVPG